MRESSWQGAFWYCWTAALSCSPVALIAVCGKMKNGHPSDIPVAELGCTKTVSQACSRQAQVLPHLSCRRLLVMLPQVVCSCLPVLSVFFAFSLCF